jgi:hypothetical protein
MQWRGFSRPSTVEYCDRQVKKKMHFDLAVTVFDLLERLGNPPKGIRQLPIATERLQIEFRQH